MEWNVLVVTSTYIYLNQLGADHELYSSSSYGLLFLVANRYDSSLSRASDSFTSKQRRQIYMCVFISV